MNSIRPAINARDNASYKVKDENKEITNKKINDIEKIDKANNTCDLIQDKMIWENWGYNFSKYFLLSPGEFSETIFQIAFLSNTAKKVVIKIVTEKIKKFTKEPMKVNQELKKDNSLGQIIFHIFTKLSICVLTKFSILKLSNKGFT